MLVHVLVSEIECKVSVCVLAYLMLSGRGWSVFLCLLSRMLRVRLVCVIVSLTRSVKGWSELLCHLN